MVLINHHLILIHLVVHLIFMVVVVVGEVFIQIFHQMFINHPVVQLLLINLISKMFKLSLRIFTF
jgi:hypothetical protein